MLSEPQIIRDTHPKQARSKARRQALLEHGVTLFNERGLDDVSIQEITQAVGFSTGSFYSYFTDKTDYFIAVLRSVAAELSVRAERVFATDRIEGLELGERLGLCINFAISYFRAHTGLVHAALSYERRVPAGWQPNRATTAMLIDKACAGLAPEDEHKLQIAIQLAYGLLVNAVLHDPGPLRLHDPDLEDRVLEALTPYFHDQKEMKRENI